MSGKKHVKSDKSTKFKNLLTPKSKGKIQKEGRYHGSYSLRNQSSPPKDCMPATPLSTFKKTYEIRQDSTPKTIQNNDASPELRERECTKPPKPLPPPRIRYSSPHLYSSFLKLANYIHSYPVLLL